MVTGAISSVLSFTFLPVGIWEMKVCMGQTLSGVVHLYVAVKCSGNALVSINAVALH